MAYKYQPRLTIGFLDILLVLLAFDLAVMIKPGFNAGMMDSFYLRSWGNSKKRASFENPALFRPPMPLALNSYTHFTKPVKILLFLHCIA